MDIQFFHEIDEPRRIEGLGSPSSLIYRVWISSVGGKETFSLE